MPACTHWTVKSEDVRALALDDRDPLKVNVLRGIVRSVTFAGRLLDCLIDIDGHELRVQALTSGPREVGD